MARIHGKEFRCASFAIGVFDGDVGQFELVDDGERPVRIGGCVLNEEIGVERGIKVLHQDSTRKSLGTSRIEARDLQGGITWSFMMTDSTGSDKGRVPVLSVESGMVAVAMLSM